MIFRIYVFMLLMNFGFSENFWCGTPDLNNRDFGRIEYTYPEFFDSLHYRVHFTLEPADSFYWNNMWMTHQSTTDYAQTVLEQAEYAYAQYENDGWQMPPADCDENIDDINNPYHCINYGGNALYDIYIGLVQGPAALVAPEHPNTNAPYIGSFTSYMLFANGLGLFGSYDDLAEINYYIVAHEIHHSIQFAYGPNFTGTPQNPIHQLWMFEQSATYMENFIYPNSLHLRLLLSNCNITTPLTEPHIGVYQTYSGALWQLFLENYLNNSNLLKYIWESYGSRITNGETHVTFFEIFNDIILENSQHEYDLEDMYKEYAIWRYFTGDRFLQNQYFDQSNLYCTSTTISNFDNNLQLQTELGGNYYIELDNDVIISIESNSENEIFGILISSHDNLNYSYVDLEFEMGDNIIDVNEDSNNVLIILSGYSNNELNFDNIIISLNDYNSNVEGDVNEDGLINVLDVVELVNCIIENCSSSVDINGDGVLNIIDIVQLVNMILN